MELNRVVKIIADLELQPVVTEEDLIEIGEDSYTPRCHDCYVISVD